jgi:DNA polymerase
MAPAAVTLSKRDRLERLRAAPNACRRCGPGRTHYVFGRGNPDATIMFIGEAPGFAEDRSGEPFVGRAGKLLSRLLAEAGIAEDSIYITNVVKCRPMRDPGRPRMPGNDRPPTRQEIAACLPVLEQQIALIRPRCICTLGNTPVRALLGTTAGIGTLHGMTAAYRGIPLLPTYHPAAALRYPALAGVIRADLCALRRLPG